MSIKTPKVRAPELVGRGWLNTGGRSLGLADLRGKITVLDFWTFCCINCLHVLDELRELEERYRDVLVVVGVHSPKFEHEADPAALAAAVERYEVHHPVLDDPELVTWGAYAARAWPTLVVIDPEGYVVAQMAGEGHASALEALVRELVAEHDAKGTLHCGSGPYVPPEPVARTLRFPATAIALPNGNLLVADAGHHSLAELAPDAETLVRRIGSGERGLTDGAADEARFSEPNGLCLVPGHLRDALGYDIVVADTVNHALRGVRLADGSVTTIAGTGEQFMVGGQENLRAADGTLAAYPLDESADPGGAWRVTGSVAPARSVRLSSPWDVEWSQAAGGFLVAMAGTHTLWLFEPAVASDGDAADGVGGAGSGVRAADGAGVAGTGVRPVDGAGAGSGTGVRPVVADGAGVAGAGVRAVDGAGAGSGTGVRPVVADGLGAAGTVRLFAGTMNEGLQDGDGGVAWFAQPSGIARSTRVAYTTDGVEHTVEQALALGQETFWIADSETSALRSVVVSRQPHGADVASVLTWVGEGLFDFGHRDGDLAEARLQHPLGVVALPDGSVVVADTYNGALRRVEIWWDETAGAEKGRVTTLATGLAEPSDVLVEPGDVAERGAAGLTLLVVESAAHRLTRIALPATLAGEILDHGVRRTQRPATAVAPGAVRLEVPFVPAPGQKLDDRWGPSTQLQVGSTPAELLLDGAGNGTDLFRDLTINPEITDGVLHVTAKAASCDAEGEFPACHLAQQDWGVPLRITTDGETTLTLPLRG